MMMRFVAGLGVGLAVGVLVGLLVGRELFGLPDMDDMMGDIEEAMGVDSYEERLAIVKEVAADPCGTAPAEPQWSIAAPRFQCPPGNYSGPIRTKGSGCTI